MSETTAPLPTVIPAKEFAENVLAAFSDPRLQGWAQDMIHQAFTEFADGSWFLDVGSPHHLAWWQTDGGDEYIELIVTPATLREAFERRIDTDAPFHPEDHDEIKDAVGKWRQAVEQIEGMLAKAGVRDTEE